MVDRPCAELDRERDRAGLGELVAVQAQDETGGAAGLEVAPRLGGVEGAALEEDVGRLGQERGLGQHLREHEVEVGVAVAVELGRHGVGAEEGRDPARGPDRAQRRELGLAVEPVARLGLEGRRARERHPVAVQPHRVRERVLAGGPRGAHGREDPAARRVELLVRHARRAQRELVDAVAREARVRVAVDETRNRAEAPPVDLLHVAVERPEVAHRPDRRDQAVLAEDVAVVDPVDVGERAPAQRRRASGRRGDLGEVADEQPGRRRCRHGPGGGIGGSKPVSRAASIASG